MSTGVVPERDVLASRLAYLTVGLPTVGTVAAVLYAVFDGLWLSDVLLFVGMYLITALGVEAGLHRYFSHRSFDASEPVKLFLGVAGSMAAQGPNRLLGSEPPHTSRVRRHRSRSTLSSTARRRLDWATEGLVARARWLVVPGEQDRLEQAHARLALGPPGDEDQCPLLLAGAAWHPATRCDRRSGNPIRSRLRRWRSLGRSGTHFRARSCDVGGELVGTHDRQPRVRAPRRQSKHRCAGTANHGWVMAQQPSRAARLGTDPSTLVAARSGRRVHPASRLPKARSQRPEAQLHGRGCRGEA